MLSLTARQYIPQTAGSPTPLYELTKSVRKFDPETAFGRVPAGSGKCPSCSWTGYPKFLGEENGGFHDSADPAQ